MLEPFGALYVSVKNWLYYLSGSAIDDWWDKIIYTVIGTSG